MSNHVPLPSISLSDPRSIRTIVKPIPIPRPSAVDLRGPFLDAKASALARTIQLTTIRGINIPRAWCSSGVKAAIIRSVIVTKEAITIMKAGILIISGIIFRNKEIMMFEETRTKAVAIPIPTPLTAEVVTASVGHIPKTRRKSGISSHKPLTRSPDTSLRFSQDAPLTGSSSAISEDATSLSAIIKLLFIHLKPPLYGIGDRTGRYRGPAELIYLSPILFHGKLRPVFKRPPLKLPPPSLLQNLVAKAGGLSLADNLYPCYLPFRSDSHQYRNVPGIAIRGNHLECHAYRRLIPLSGIELHPDISIPFILTHHHFLSILVNIIIKCREDGLDSANSP